MRVQCNALVGFTSFIGSFSPYKKHLEVCNGVTVSCELCGKEMLRKDV